MLRREERDEFHVRSIVQNVNRLSACAVAPSVIRDKPYAHPCKLFEIVSLKHINSRQDLSIIGRLKRRRRVRSA